MYDESVASVLARIPLDSDPDAFWRVIRAEVEARLGGGEAGLARQIISAVESHPPGVLTNAAREGLGALAIRAAQLPTSTPATDRAASQPAADTGSEP
jgi:hypothetical protein